MIRSTASIATSSLEGPRVTPMTLAEFDAAPRVAAPRGMGAAEGGLV